MSKNIYQFKILLTGTKPPIWRRIQVPESFNFWNLHCAIQDSMGWDDSHLHQFSMLNPQTLMEEEITEVNDDMVWDEGRIVSPFQAYISDYFSADNKKAEYVYDFGDDWVHKITLEKILPAEEGRNYPLCLTGKRACPPEDCGGVWGYENLLSILQNPNHEDYASTLEWVGDGFEPEVFDAKKVLFDDPQERYKLRF